MIRRGRAVPAQSPLKPHTTGYDPAFKSEMSDYDPARARALLDLYGFVDRDGDGFRERPDGSPLELVMATEADQIYRHYNELWKKCMQAVGIRMRFNTNQWPENLKAADAGKLMMWQLGETATSPDGQTALARWYGPMSGPINFARFQLAEFDRVYEQASVLPDGPERLRLLRQAQTPRGGLHAVQGARAPHPHRSGASVGGRFPPAAVRRRVVAHGRCRHGAAASAPFSMNTGPTMTRIIDALGARLPRLLLAVCCGVVVSAAVPRNGWAQDAGAPKKVLRYAFEVAETSFDPVQDQRPVLAHGDTRTSSRRRTSSTIWRGR